MSRILYHSRREFLFDEDSNHDDAIVRSVVYIDPDEDKQDSDPNPWLCAELAVRFGHQGEMKIAHDMFGVNSPVCCPSADEFERCLEVLAEESVKVLEAFRKARKDYKDIA